MTSMISTPWSYTAADHANAQRLLHKKMPCGARRCPDGPDCPVIASGGRCRYHHPKAEIPCRHGHACWLKACAFKHPDGWNLEMVNNEHKCKEWINKLGKPCSYETRCNNVKCASTHDPSWWLYARNQDFKEEVLAALEERPDVTP